MPDPFIRLAPVMTVREIVYLENLLLQQAKFAKGELDVLEWGSGGSTVYFSDFLRFREIPFSWVSVEHHPFWAEKVRELAGPGVRVALRDPTENNPKEEEFRSVPMDDYVTYPTTLNRRFDLILVDGRRRRRCLLTAAALLAPGGIAVLHDSERTYYSCAFASYPDARFVDGTTFWEGRHNQHSDRVPAVRLS